MSSGVETLRGFSFALYREEMNAVLDTSLQQTFPKETRTDFLKKSCGGEVICYKLKTKLLLIPQPCNSTY